MRVHVAYDGSEQAELALELTAALPWPAGTAVRVAQVVAPFALSTASAGGALGLLDRALADALGDAVSPLVARGLAVDREVLHGDVADTLIRDAERWRADLLICGSRGHGPLASALLGSVATTLTEHAPCPVLVARRAAVTRVVFADDGSPSAAAARGVLDWPVFAGTPVRVVSVAVVPQVMASGIAPTLYEEARRVGEEMARELRAEHERYASAAAETLRASGRSVEHGVRTGDAASEIIAAADAAGADLIVMGTRGRGRMARLLLGSVARKVLQHARCSVLVVRKR